MFWGKKNTKEVKYEKKLKTRREMKKIGRCVVEIEMLDGRRIQEEVLGYIRYLTYPIVAECFILVTAEEASKELFDFTKNKDTFVDYREPNSIYYRCTPVKAEIIQSNVDFEAEFEISYEELVEVTE